MYASPILGQPKSDQLKKLIQFPEKALRITNFFPDGVPLQKIYQNSKLLKLPDYKSLQNVRLVKDFFKGSLPKPLKTCFIRHNNQHQQPVPHQKTVFLCQK